MITAEKNRLQRARGALRDHIRAQIYWMEKEILDMDMTLKRFTKGSPMWGKKDNLFQSVGLARSFRSPW